jgi:hypothetical protein
MTNNDIKPDASTEPAVQRSASEIAEIVLGPIHWLDSNGYCECPGKAKHSMKDGAKDCMVFLDAIPTIHCVHASCANVMKEVNRKLRKAVLDGTNEKARKLTPEEKEKLAARKERERMRERAAKALPHLLKTWKWSYNEIIGSSPAILPVNASEHWKLLLSKFAPDDVIWIGDTFHSGKPEHTTHFKTAADWLKESATPGPFICPATFKNTSHARSNDNVVTRRFLVVESDVLSKDEVGAIFKWLRDAAKLDLVAIVDTAGKSLHGWFAFPADDEKLDDLKLILPAYGCDPKLFTASQPVRLPGAPRNDKFQKLVYLKEGGAA